MKLQPAHQEILKYLDEHSAVNTFKLSKDLRIERGELINLVEELTKEKLTNFRSGTVTKGNKESQKVIERKIQKSKDNWLKKEEEVKGEIEDLQIQRNDITQKLKKERALLYQIQKGKKETEKNLIEWEKSINKREEDIQKREKYVSTAKKRLKREREKLKEKKIKEPKAVAKKIKPVPKPEIEKSGETGVSKTENKQPEIIAKKPWQPAIETKENIYYRFHDLIEHEIDLLKQKRIDEVRDIHLKIKGMISTVTDTNQRKTIINDWNRIKEFY